MASWTSLLVVLARFSSVAFAAAALLVASDDSRSPGVHSTAVVFVYSSVALSSLIAGYTLLLLSQVVAMVMMDLPIPLPDDLLSSASIIAMDWALALFAYGTSCAAISVIVDARQRHVLVESVATPFLDHSVLGLVSGLFGVLTALCEMWLAPRLPGWAQLH